MTMALILFAAGGLGLFVGLLRHRPGLVFVSGGIVLFHALPLALFDETAASATLVAYRDTAIAIAVIIGPAFYLGYWALARAPTPSPPPERVSTPPRRIHGLLLLILAGLIAVSPGGLPGFAEAGFLRVPVESPLHSTIYALACVAAFTTTIQSVHAAAGRTAQPWLSMAIVLLVFWMLGGRTQFVITGIAFGLVLLSHRRLGMRGLLMPILAAGLLSLMTLSFRLSLQGQTTDLAATTLMSLSQLSLLEGYALAARIVDEAGHQVGHYWTTALQLLPRALFPEKPLQLSRALRFMAARDTLGGLTPGLAGEAFAAGGLIWVAATGIAFGGTLAVVDNAYRRLPQLGLVSQALVVCLLPLLAIFVMRGGLDTTIFRLAILLFTAGLMALWNTSRHWFQARALWR
ncbi:hypothetical protein [Devosia sp.]|uniref:hypothetical protein n=1 Tax=Devosia sp. TaxID=1871048 RepID=UPI001ACD5897|nr:hypothetical protein [Devosia sp.]MBN9334331.1 hypothetical protein [Devosia sp.]